MWAGIIPTQMLAAPIALAVRPRMLRELGVPQRGHAGLTAAERAVENHDMEAYPFRIREIEFVLALIKEPMFFIGDAVET